METDRKLVIFSTIFDSPSSWRAPVPLMQSSLLHSAALRNVGWSSGRSRKGNEFRELIAQPNEEIGVIQMPKIVVVVGVVVIMIMKSNAVAKYPIFPKFQLSYSIGKKYWFWEGGTNCLILFIFCVYN